MYTTRLYVGDSLKAVKDALQGHED